MHLGLPTKWPAQPANRVTTYLLFTGDALDAPTASMAGLATCRPSSDAPASYKVISNPPANPSPHSPLFSLPLPVLDVPNSVVAMALVDPVATALPVA